MGGGDGGEERKERIFHHSPNGCNGQIGSQELLTGLPLGCKYSRTSTILHSFSRLFTESWTTGRACGCQIASTQATEDAGRNLAYYDPAQDPDS